MMSFYFSVTNTFLFLLCAVLQEHYDESILKLPNTLPQSTGIARGACFKDQRFIYFTIYLK